MAQAFHSTSPASSLQPSAFGLVLVVGSVAYDTVETATEKHADLLGGSAVYFALAARLFSPVAIAGMVGGDFRQQDRELLAAAGVDIECLATAPAGRTFRWHGRYHEDMNERDTVSVALNVLDGYRPQLPANYRRCPYVFLANGSTDMQLALLEQVAPHRPLVLFDTMDLWIETERAGVLELLKRTSGIILNDSEAPALSGARNLLHAARRLRELGAGCVVIKKGEHGALALLPTGATVALPGYPLDTVADPTGAGDAFAGAFMGWLAAANACRTHPSSLPACAADVAAGSSRKSQPSPGMTAFSAHIRRPPGERDKASECDYRAALAAATVTASFCVERFGVAGLLALEKPAFERRLAEYRQVIRSD